MRSAAFLVLFVLSACAAPKQPPKEQQDSDVMFEPQIIRAWPDPRPEKERKRLRRLKTRQPAVHAFNGRPER